MKQGARMKLLQLTETSAPVKGSVRMGVVVRMDDGTLVEMEGPMFVVEGMTVPVLLGEDFQQAYEMTSGYTKTAIPSSRSQELRQEVLVVERVYIGEQPTQDFLKKAARHKWQKNFKAKKKALKEDDYILRAAEDVTLKPESVVRVAVTGPFSAGGDWVVEKEMLSSTTERPFLVPNALVAADNPFIPVANTATTPRRIRKGEALGRAHRVEDFFDKPSSKEQAKQMEDHASFLSKVCRAREKQEAKVAEKAREGPGKVDAKFRMPEASSYEAWKEGKRTFPMPVSEVESSQ
ncbi:hypothetical protein K525DRAFT_275772 [Schizophyllum commune Loenen D]|nr:hypothetical protein K525DRAFT_275772 [Schizophyllum commune Loenen D]